MSSWMNHLAHDMLNVVQNSIQDIQIEGLFLNYNMRINKILTFFIQYVKN